jgi:hypothetical protein
MLPDKEVGCFFCCNIYSSKEIKEYVDQGKTAACPHCNVDSVGTFKEILEKLRKYAFEINTHKGEDK